MTTGENQFLFRILRLLEEDLPEIPFQLRHAETLLFSSGSIIENAGHTVPFLGHELLLGKAPDQITPREKIAIKSTERLAKLLAPRVRPPRTPVQGALGTISLKVLLGAFLEILKLLESKSILLNNYERIIQLNQQVLLARDLQGCLQTIMDMARGFVGGGGSSLLLVDARTGEMFFNIISGERESELREIRIPAGKGIAGSVVQNARAEIIRDVRSDPRAFHGVDRSLNQTTRDMIVAPIIARGAVIGVIEVVNSSSPYGFLNEDLEFLMNIAGHTSLLVENAKSKEELVRANRELDRKVSQVNALHEIGLALAASLDADVLQKNLLRNILRLLRLRHGEIFVPDYENRAFVSAYRLEFDEQVFREIPDHPRLEDAGDLLVWMQENGEPLAFVGPGDEAGIARRFFEVNAHAFGAFAPELWVPVHGPDEEGVLFVLSLSGSLLSENQWSQDSVFFQGLMTEARSAFRNVRSFQNVLKAREEENHVRRVFQKYVPARVVQEVLTREENPSPRSQIISVLFADIWGFTRLAENLEPSRLVELLNEFFEEMVGAVSARGGIVDKFMGDSLMALFGVPDPDPTGATGALRAALEMHDRLAEINRRRRSLGDPEFRMAIGLHHGPAIVGNVGSTRRTDFTAVGDTVNLASRLERLNRQYSSGTLCTEPVALAAEGTGLGLREVDLVRVRGRASTTRLFELARDAATADRWEKTRADWLEALDRYRAGAFAQALARIGALAEENPQDAVLNLYRERCEFFLREPPENGWDGVFKVDV